jgi:pilus assembly protein CpaB
MNKKNLLKLWGIAFVVAVVSTGIIYGLYVSKLSSATGNGRMLVVAAKDLKPGTVLKDTDLKLIAWPEAQALKGGYGKASDVVGETVFDTIGEDEPVFDTHLASKRSGGGSGVPDGMRAVSVHVTDSTGVMQLLRAGQKVDVQVVVGRTGSVDKADTAVRTALEDLTVLSVIPTPEQGSQGANLPVVTLLAKPADADILATADSGARVRLTLRNPLDQEMRGSGQLTLSTVMHSTAKSEAAKAAGDSAKGAASTPPAASTSPKN